MTTNVYSVDVLLNRKWSKFIECGNWISAYFIDQKRWKILSKSFLRAVNCTRVDCSIFEFRLLYNLFFFLTILLVLRHFSIGFLIKRKIRCYARYWLSRIQQPLKFTHLNLTRKKCFTFYIEDFFHHFGLKKSSRKTERVYLTFSKSASIPFD